jgi:hypothetical protein
METAMWIFMKNAFLSVVAHETEEGLLHVRARFRGDIESVFPEADVAETPHADYGFGTSVSRDRFADALANYMRQISYTSFKDQIVDLDRRDAYIRVWEQLWQAQREAQEREGSG